MRTKNQHTNGNNNRQQQSQNNNPLLIIVVILCGLVWITITGTIVPSSTTVDAQGTHKPSVADLHYPPPPVRPTVPGSVDPTEPPEEPTEPPEEPTEPPLVDEPTPTSKPRPLYRRDVGGSHYTAPLSEGAITGTVIDSTTGFPVAGVAVQVGNKTVYTDQYGNYARFHLPTGRYSIELLLDKQTGIPLQQPLVVSVVGDTMMIRHLFYTSNSSDIDYTNAYTLEYPIERTVPPAPTATLAP